MEIRKVQTNAAGTFLVTIPKDWVAKMGLEKGGLVSLELEDADVIISSVNKRTSSQSRPLDIDSVRDRKMLELSISASYIRGHDITEIVSKNKVLPEQKRWIKEAVENLIGVEISEEYSDRVVLQNLVDPRIFDLDTLMKKFNESSLAVFGDAISSLERGDKLLAQDAFERGYDLTKQYRLLMRLALLLLRNRKLRDDMKTYEIDGIVLKILAIKDLGRIAYYSYRVAQHVTELKEKPDSSVITVAKKMAKTTLEMQERAFSSFMAKDPGLASSVVDRMDEVRKQYETLYAFQVKSASATNSLPLSLIIRDIRGIAGYAVALADDATLASFK
jgi:phosphate uptake regulator